MRRLTVKKTIDIPADRAWEVISKNGQVWPCKEGPGEIVAGRVAQWVEGEGVPTGIMDKTIPLRRAKASMSVRHAGPHASEVAVTMDYAVGYGPFGALIHALILRPAIRKALGRAIEAIAPCARAGGTPAKKRRREGPLMEATTVIAA